jgi:two-component system, chemotaxis family, protein-glutamate methylesterase/glutaminase
MSPALKPAAAGEPPVRVMIVDDAVVVRGLIARWLEEAGGFEVVASHRTGRLAVDDVERVDPDVVVLDIEMPDMDGIEALPLILRKKRHCAVVMASTLTRRNAEISLKCLTLGALDCVAKPQASRDVSMSAEFRQEIVEKIGHLGRRARAAARAARRPPPRPAAPTRPARAAAGQAAHAQSTHVQATLARSTLAPTARPAGTARPQRPAAPGAIRLRPFPSTPPRLLVIGASTGGPQALNTVIGGLAPLVDTVPVLITQHMPATFTTILAEHLARASGRKAAEAVDGEAVRPGRIYVAPGGRHMRLQRAEAHAVVTLDDGPLVNFCRPAVDPLFSTAAAVFGPSVSALVLTGMGTDGMAGAGRIVEAGGSVIAQDEATSVVWGMPGAAAEAGHCSAVLPLDAIAPRILRLFAGDRS